MDFTKALEIDPEFALAYSGRGFTNEAIGKFEDALKDFKNFIQYASGANAQYINLAEKKIKELEEKLR
jgi:tetratricopeptide (TPR) repeat protein